MTLFNSRMLMVGAAILLPLCACNSTDGGKAAAPSTDAVAATVNGTPINESRIKLLAKGQQVDADVRKQIIDHLSTQFLIAQEAVKKGLDKTPEVIDQIDLTRQSVLANAFIQDYLKNTPVTDDMLKAEYEKIKGQMGGTEYKARHILVDKEADAKDIIAKVKKNPAAFAALAKEKSKDPGSKANGGDLGWFDARGMVPEFGAAVAQLAKGAITDVPVKSQFGYHVIMLEDTRAKAVPPLEQVKQGLQQQVQQQNLKKLFDDLKAKAKIDIVQAPAPAAPAAPAAKDATPAAKDAAPAAAKK